MVNYSTDNNKTNNHLTSNHWAQKRSQHLYENAVHCIDSM